MKQEKGLAKAIDAFRKTRERRTTAKVDSKRQHILATSNDANLGDQKVDKAGTAKADLELSNLPDDVSQRLLNFYKQAESLQDIVLAHGNDATDSNKEATDTALKSIKKADSAFETYSRTVDGLTASISPEKTLPMSYMPQHFTPNGFESTVLNQSDLSQTQVAESVKLSEQLECALKANAQLAQFSEKQTEAPQDLAEDKTALVTQLEQQLVGLRQKQLAMAAQQHDTTSKLHQAQTQVQEVEKSCLWIQQQSEAEIEQMTTQLQDTQRKLNFALAESDTFRTDLEKANAEKAQSEHIHSCTINELLARIANLEQYLQQQQEQAAATVQRRIAEQLEREQYVASEQKELLQKFTEKLNEGEIEKKRIETRYKEQQSEMERRFQQQQSECLEQMQKGEELAFAQVEEIKEDMLAALTEHNQVVLKMKNAEQKAHELEAALLETKAELSKQKDDLRQTKDELAEEKSRAQSFMLQQAQLGSQLSLVKNYTSEQDAKVASAKQDCRTLANAKQRIEHRLALEIQSRQRQQSELDRLHKMCRQQAEENKVLKRQVAKFQKFPVVLQEQESALLIEKEKTKQLEKDRNTLRSLVDEQASRIGELSCSYTDLTASVSNQSLQTLESDQKIKRLQHDKHELEKAKLELQAEVIRLLDMLEPLMLIRKRI